jgi:hypothetical protein
MEKLIDITQSPVDSRMFGRDLTYVDSTTRVPYSREVVFSVEHMPLPKVDDYVEIQTELRDQLLESAAEIRTSMRDASGEELDILPPSSAVEMRIIEWSSLVHRMVYWLIQLGQLPFSTEIYKLMVDATVTLEDAEVTGCSLLEMIGIENGETGEHRMLENTKTHKLIDAEEHVRGTMGLLFTWFRAMGMSRPGKSSCGARVLSMAKRT